MPFAALSMLLYMLSSLTSLPIVPSPWSIFLAALSREASAISALFEASLMFSIVTVQIVPVFSHDAVEAGDKLVEPHDQFAAVVPEGRGEVLDVRRGLAKVVQDVFHGLRAALGAEDLAERSRDLLDVVSDCGELVDELVHVARRTVTWMRSPSW